MDTLHHQPSTMSSSTSSYALGNPWMHFCQCGTRAPVKTSWTGGSVGRRLWACEKYRVLYKFERIKFCENLWKQLFFHNFYNHLTCATINCGEKTSRSMWKFTKKEEEEDEDDTLKIFIIISTICWHVKSWLEKYFHIGPSWHDTVFINTNYNMSS